MWPLSESSLATLLFVLQPFHRWTSPRPLFLPEQAAASSLPSYLLSLSSSRYQPPESLSAPQVWVTKPSRVLSGHPALPFIVCYFTVLCFTSPASHTGLSVPWRQGLYAFACGYFPRLQHSLGINRHLSQLEVYTGERNCSFLCVEK